MVANTWPLLAIEAESARRITGGGFPMGKNFEQPERVLLFIEMKRNPRRTVLERAREVTGASECWYMVEERFLSPGVLRHTLRALGNPAKRVGDVWAWKVGSSDF